MAVNDIYEAVLLTSVNGEKCANVLHYRVETDPATLDPADDLADAIETQLWTGGLDQCMSNDVTLQQIRCRRIAPTLGGVIIRPVDLAGTVAEDTLPPNNCVVITFYTSRTDRSGRGRIHLAGVPETFQQDGLLNVTSANLYAAFASGLASTITGGDSGIYRFGVYSKTVPEYNALVRNQVRSWIHTIRGRRMVAP